MSAKLSCVFKNQGDLAVRKVPSILVYAMNKGSVLAST